MLAFGYASIMLCLGMLLRAKVPFLRNMLVPASVIGGFLGFLFMNILTGIGVDIGTDMDMYTTVVNQLFTVSFISISLTSTREGEKNRSGHVIKGAIGLGLIWCFLYALTPLLGAGAILLFGKDVGMDAIYGMLVPFAFCQGPGQSAAYGAIIEQYGWDNASTVAIALSAAGFVAAFLIGIPAAKRGIRKGLAKNCSRLDGPVLKGYYTKIEQTEVMVRDTTHNGNIETLTFHFAMIGVCYVLAVGISKVFALLPGFLGSSMSGMMFMNGMYAAYIVKWIMKRLKLDFLQENVLQGKITGWTSDYLVVCAFMAVSVSVIRAWLPQLAILVVITTAVTVAVCFYFGQRIGGDNDFERTLGIYGTCTGTVPSGIALVRIVDPEFRTTTAIELGACNLTMLASTPVYLLILGFAAGSIRMSAALSGMAVCAVIYLAALKLTKTWGKKTFSWR